MAGLNGVVYSFGEATSLHIVNGRLVFILESKELQFIPSKDESLSSEMTIPTIRLNIW
jgi:hypothetical protein